MKIVFKGTHTGGEGVDGVSGYGGDWDTLKRGNMHVCTRKCSE